MRRQPYPTHRGLEMWGVALVSGCTAALAVAGFCVGHTLHGPAVAALVPTAAGAAGGFGAGCAALDVLRRWRASHSAPPPSSSA